MQWLTGHPAMHARFTEFSHANAGENYRGCVSVAFARLFGKVLFELSFFAVMFFGIRQLVLFGRDVGPDFGVSGVDLQPAVQAGLGVGLDGLGRAFGFTHAAVDAFVRVNDKHVFTFIKTIDRAHFNTVCVFALDAILDDNIGHAGMKLPKICLNEAVVN